MKDCGDDSVNIRLYLDNELTGPDLEHFLAHLKECVACRKRLSAEEELTSLLHRQRPLYSASDALRSRVMSALTDPLPTFRAAPTGLGKRILRFFAQPGAAGTPCWQAQAAVVLLLIAGPLLLPKFLQRCRGGSYVEAAVAAHRNLLNGSLPLAVQTDSPGAVSAWFAGKVPFLFRLPDSDKVSDEEPIYRLIGGSLVNYKGAHAALIAFQAQQEKISLLVTSSRSAVAAGGEEVPFDGLVFHYNHRAGFNVITWSNHDLTYALVSSLPGHGRQSCQVCHQSIESGDHLSALR